ncbi:MAG: murein biosynthesis integral membrane protein MurJ, partial [Anaerolineae bacterium]
SRSTDYESRLTSHAFTVMAAFVLSRLLGLAREMAISSHFGTSGELDAYLAAFRIPDILFQLMAGGALASAFIPTFAGLLANNDNRTAWRLVYDLIRILVAGLGLLSLVCALLARPLVGNIVAPGFDPARQALTANLMRIMLLTPVVFAVSGIFMGILNSYQRFLAAALAPSAYNLAIILGALLLAPHFGAYGLALGVVVGAMLHYLSQLPQVWRLMRDAQWSAIRGMDLTPQPPFPKGEGGGRPPSPAKGEPALSRSPEHREGTAKWVGGEGRFSPQVRAVVRLMLPRTVGLAAVQVNFLVNTILASLLSPGSLAIINFAWMLMLLPQGVFAQGVATAVFPTFSALAARQEWQQLRELLLKALRGVLFLAIPATLGLILLRQPIVSLIFQRRAFGADSVAAVAWVLAFYSLGLCAHCGLEVLTRAYYALHDTRTPVAVGLIAMSLNVLFSLALMRPLREAGLALANSLATWLELAALWLILGGRLAGLRLAPLLPALARIGVASAFMVLCLLLLRLLPLAPALAGLAGIALGGIAYLAASAALGVPEVKLALARGRGMMRGG